VVQLKTQVVSVVVVLHFVKAPLQKDALAVAVVVTQVAAEAQAVPNGELAAAAVRLSRVLPISLNQAFALAMVKSSSTLMLPPGALMIVPIH
jgi:hypothetical protein